MEGNPLRRRHALRVVRCFTPTRLAEDLLAEVYERLCELSRRSSTGQDCVLKRELQELPLGREALLATGGRQ